MDHFVVRVKSGVSDHALKFYVGGTSTEDIDFVMDIKDALIFTEFDESEFEDAVSYGVIGIDDFKIDYEYLPAPIEVDVDEMREI